MAKHVHTHQERSAVLLWCACSLSHVPRFVTPWTAARKALLSMGILQARILEVSCHALLQGTSPTQGSYPGLPHCKWDSLPTESPGKPKNTGVGSLSLLQGDFLTQEWNQVSSIAGRLFTDCVDHNKLWEIPQEMRRPDYLTCLLQPVCRSRSNS